MTKPTKPILKYSAKDLNKPATIEELIGVAKNLTTKEDFSKLSHQFSALADNVSTLSENIAELTQNVNNLTESIAKTLDHLKNHADRLEYLESNLRLSPTL